MNIEISLECPKCWSLYTPITTLRWVQLSSSWTRWLISFLKADQLFLEDESGRILLVQWAGGLARQMVTGVTVAVKGQVLEGGEFKVYTTAPPTRHFKINTPQRHAPHMTCYIELINCAHSYIMTNRLLLRLQRVMSDDCYCYWVLFLRVCVAGGRLLLPALPPYPPPRPRLLGPPLRHLQIPVAGLRTRVWVCLDWRRTGASSGTLGADAGGLCRGSSGWSTCCPGSL
jgi:hypothetical protein